MTAWRKITIRPGLAGAHLLISGEGSEVYSGRAFDVGGELFEIYKVGTHLVLCRPESRRPAAVFDEEKELDPWLKTFGGESCAIVRERHGEEALRAHGL